MPDLERVLQNTPLTVSHQFAEDGVAVDPGSVTVGITRADGTVLEAPGQATGGAGTAPRTFLLTSSHTALLDTLTITWDSPTKGEVVSYVEVVGGFMFTLAELTALKPGNATWTTTQKVEKRNEVEEAIEREYGAAVVPRYSYETIRTTDSWPLQLRWPVIRSIRSLSHTYGTTTTALTQSELDTLTFTARGQVHGYSWTLGYGTWTIGYEHGLDYPPARLKLNALRLARQWLVNGPIDDRAAVFNAGADGGTYSLVVPGRNQSVFGLPDLDAVINASPYRVGV